MVTLEQAKAYVDRENATDSNEAYIQDCLDEATELVTVFIGTVEVPDVALNRAIKECLSELFHRRSAPNGLAQFTGYDGTALRIARDPMVGAYPILARYMVIGL